ncbi:MAG: hypothetical protein VW455_13425 [Nitrospinota bacterium]
MSKQKLNSPEQITIDDLVASTGQNILPEIPDGDSCNVTVQLKGILIESIRASEKSREEIAKIMTARLSKGQTISKAQIDSWTRSDGERHIPLEYIYAFEVACNTSAITEYLCKLHGGMFIDQRSSEVLKLGQLQILKTQLLIKEQELQKGLI